jgi:putative endonuclease
MRRLAGPRRSIRARPGARRTVDASGGGETKAARRTGDWFPPLRGSLGERGERAARRFLLGHGYSVLGRNIRRGGVEADLLLLDPARRTLVIAEVKTLRDPRRDPLARVDRRKRQRLERFAKCLLRQDRFRDCGVRFDLLAVHSRWYGMVVQHIPGAWREGD